MMRNAKTNVINGIVRNGRGRIWRRKDRKFLIWCMENMEPLGQTLMLV
jgi:hypothetical protein